MRRFFLRTMLIAAGVCLLLSGLSFRLGAAPAHAQDQPPPRPTLTPVPPTPKPASHHDTAVPAGRITGTVIDLTTGAPVPHVAVTVGDQTVFTDANGNYDRNGLPAGSYPLALALAAGQGEPAQQLITVTLASDATVVQHLAFRSPAAVVPAAASIAPMPPALPRTAGSADFGWGALALGLLMIAVGLGMRRVRAGAG